MSHRSVTPDAPRSQREPLWDIARFVAIALVVVGHAIERFDDSPAMNGLYAWIYAFHMPLFAFVSGRFARAEPITIASGRKLVQQLLVPYVVFSALWFGIDTLTGQRAEFDLGGPYWYLWFLVSLTLWRLTLPLMASFRFPMTVALVIALTAGLMPSVGWHLALSRTLTFLPFFIAGWQLSLGTRQAQLFAVIRRPWVRIVSAVLLTATLAACLRYEDAIREWNLRQWFQGNRNYFELDAAGLDAVLMRGLVLACSFTLILLVVSAVPSRSQVMAAWGGRTMVVYLLHLPAIVLFFHYSKSMRWFDEEWKFLVLIAGALALAILLSTRMVQWLTRWLIEPPSWLFRSTTPARSQ